MKNSIIILIFLLGCLTELHSTDNISGNYICKQKNQITLHAKIKKISNNKISFTMTHKKVKSFGLCSKSGKCETMIFTLNKKDKTYINSGFNSIKQTKNKVVCTLLGTALIFKKK